MGNAGHKIPAQLFFIFPFIVQFPKSSGERWVGVAPFAKHKGKIYPLDRMEKVVSKLSEESRVKIFLFGSGDRERKILSLWRERYPGVIS